jgi:hypothetical protein
MHHVMYEIDTIDGLIPFLGGPSAVAATLGITQEAVSNWKIREYIPRGWHVTMIAACRRRGKSVDPQVFGMSDDDWAALFPPQSPSKRRRSCPSRPSA